MTFGCLFEDIFSSCRAVVKWNVTYLTVRTQWLLYLPPFCLHSGHTFLLPTCFVWIARENGVSSHPVYNINGLAFITEMVSVYCAVRIDALKV